MFNESDDELEVFTPPVDFNRNGGWCRKNVVFVLSVMSIASAKFRTAFAQAIMTKVLLIIHK